MEYEKKTIMFTGITSQLKKKKAGLPNNLESTFNIGDHEFRGNL